MVFFLIASEGGIQMCLSSFVPGVEIEGRLMAEPPQHRHGATLPRSYFTSIAVHHPPRPDPPQPRCAFSDRIFMPIYKKGRSANPHVP